MSLPISSRPGSVLARRPLHFIVLADCSGSMAADGKIQALNTAMREAIPHLVDVTRQNPHAEVRVRAIAFGNGARWHLADAVPVEQVTWIDLSASGYTDLGAALDLLSSALTTPPMEERALPPAIVLISDGMPTDAYRPALDRLLALPWGQRSVRSAIGIGRDADQETLRSFLSQDQAEPLSASNPEQLIRMVRWASVHASQVASTVTPTRRYGPTAMDADDISEVVW